MPNTRFVSPVVSPDTVGALWQQGLDTVDIARRLWTRQHDVCRLLHKWREDRRAARLRAERDAEFDAAR